MIPSGTKFVGINPNFPTAERKSAQNNAAQEVYTIEEILESTTLQQVSDAGGLDNGSTIRQGSVSRLGLTGIEQVCSNEKMIQWVDGREVYYSSGNPVVHVNSINDDIPNEFYDETLGIVIGSRYTVLNTGITYICTDATEDNAVWSEISNGVPYKVYTALLTQSGVTSTYNIGAGILSIGVTYTIQDTYGDADFTNVGAPNNNIGTSFVATGTTPNSWGSNGTLGYDEGAPVVTVLENTIGNIWFTYNNVGQYTVLSDTLFTNNKTAIFNKTLINWRRAIITDISNTSQISILTVALDDAGSGVDGLLLNTPIEIRVYN
jgi:hypothetical protein